jgi:hypothetical protein
MGKVDKERIAAVRTLEHLGFKFDGRNWVGGVPAIVPEADALHGLLMDRAEALAGGTDGSPEADELATIADVLEAYEAKRWPDGRIAGGKG